MAEGGDLTSIKDGSDNDFEYTCSPCGEDHIRVEAVKYCPVCQEYLCVTCTRHHGRQRATRAHTLLDCTASRQMLTVSMRTKCRYHPDREIEMYCEGHDMVYCLKCIATEHRSCKNVSSLEDVNIPSKQQKELQCFKTDTKHLQMRLQKCEQKTQTNIDNIEEQKSGIISKVEGLEQDLVEHIRKLKHNTLKALESEYTLVKENLGSEISQIRKTNVDIERECQQLQTFDDLDKMQQFVQVKLIQQTVNDAKKVLGQIDTKKRQHLHFTENQVLKSSLITSTCLGRIQNETEGSSVLSSTEYKVSSKEEFNVKMTNDKNVCYISAICQLPDGTIILADLNNTSIKRLDRDYNIKDYLDVGNNPTGICHTGNTEVAVKLLNDKVQFISIGRSMSKLRDISITGGCYCGIAYRAGDLWVSTGSGLNVYSVSGTLLKTISKDVNGQSIFKSFTQQMTVCGDAVIVADFRDGAVCLRTDGTVVRELRDGRLKGTCGICVSDDCSIVFIAGYSSHNIVMFDRDGKCLAELLDKGSGLRKPRCLCYDKEKKCLIVGSYGSNILTVLNLSV